MYRLYTLADFSPDSLPSKQCFGKRAHSCYNQSGLSLTDAVIMETPSAITKILLPSKRTHLLHRPRLVNFLHEHIDRKLLLVSASAGYGKTSLLIDFAHETPLPVCWYSLDASDADPKTFLQYLVASVHHAFPKFGSRTLGLLENISLARDVEVIVGALVTEIYENIPGYFVLVLDDYHAVEESEPVNRILDTFLRLQPENAHLILASRTLPSKLTLTRLTARQEIAGLGVNDLRFTAEEIRALVKQNYQTDLSDTQAKELAETSEGWITGILLTTHTLWRGLFQDLVRLQGSHSHVFNYLASEVFAQQSPELRQFLLDTSIFNDLAPEMCDALLQARNSSETLRLIEQKNLFIVRLEQEDAWYRYHHLFQEFLQARLRESDAERWRDLNRRAAELYAARALFDRAIMHYLKAELFDDAARVIENIAQETFDAGHLTTLARWIDALPSEVLDMHPHLIATRARVFTDLGDQHHALEFHSRALKLFEQQRDHNGIGKTLVYQAVSLRFLGRYQEAIDTCTQALKVLPADQTQEIMRAHRSMGTSYFSLGNPTKAIQELESALQLCASLNDPTRIAWLHHDLGVAYRIIGNIEAEKHFQQALDYWHHTNNAVGLASTLNSIGVGYHRQGKYTQATETLEQARKQAHQAGHLRWEAYALASLGDVYRDQNDYAHAQDTYRTAYDIAVRISDGFIITYTLTALGELCRLLDEPETANSLLHQAIEQAESHQSSYELGLTTTALGILNCQQGNADAALSHLTNAVELLDRSDAKRDRARAHIHLAHIYFLEHKQRLAKQHLRITADLGTDLREDQFILTDAQHLLPVIKYAVAQQVGKDYFAPIPGKIKTLATTATHVPSIRTVEPQSLQLEVRALGTTQVSIGGKLVSKSDWDSASAKELFLFLLAHPQGLRKEQIFSALWAEMPPTQANGIFHSTAYRIRRALSPTILVYENGLYRVNPVNVWSDVEQFAQLIDQAHHAQTDDERVGLYRDAIALYQGDYTEDSYSDWCMPLRDELQKKYLDALSTLAEYYDQHGLSQAIGFYQKILQRDPYREDIYRALMRFQAKSGDKTSALKTYQECIQVLQTEMGVPPSPETRALYEDIRNDL